MSESMPPREMLFLDVRAAGGVATAHLNDLPVARVGTPRHESTELPPPREAKPVHQLVVPGINRLRVEVDAPSTRVLARLVWFAEGDVADSDSAGRIAAELTLPLLGEQDQPGGPVRRVESVSLDLGSAWGEPFWRAASPVHPDGPTLDRAEDALRAIGSALERGDGDRFVELLGPYLDDALRAFPGLERDHLERIHRDYAKALGAGGRVDVAPRARWAPRIVGEGRLLDLRDDEGAPVVSIHFPDERPVAYPLWVGWRDGQLLVVR